MEYTVSRTEYGAVERALNLTASCLIKSGLPVGNLSAQSILEAAKKKTGLDDWGSEDFIARLEILGQFAQGSHITPLAHVFARQTFIQAVSNRLKMEDYLKRHPEILQYPIKKPIFIVGFPRTGTTLMQNLLSLEPRRRALRFWELTAPAPVSEDRDSDRQTRMRTASRILKLAYLLSPEMAEVHEIRIDTAEECWPLFANTFAVMNYDLSSGFKNYGDWLLKQDMLGPYQEFRRQLQLLAAQEPTDHFVLKCPEHLWFLDSLLNVFPDACIVWTHRDPVASIASYCSLVSLNRRTFYGSYEPHALGRHITERFLEGINRATAVADAERSDRFFHVNFDALVKDPTTIVKQICEKFGYGYSSNMDAAIEAWQSNSRKDKRGKHKYSADRYGLDSKEIHSRYSQYISARGISIQNK